jgi:hypothetical protein
MNTAGALDLDAFRAPQGDRLPKPPARKPPRHRQGESFLKGPIPWAWLRRALTLPGKALHVALLLWKEAGCRRNGLVPFRLAGTAELGIHPDTAKRGLRALERAGLVSVHHSPGRALRVALLDAPADGTGASCGD